MFRGLHHLNQLVDALLHLAHAPAQVVVTPQPAPVIVYQPGSVTVKEVPATTRRDGSSLAEDKGP